MSSTGFIQVHTYASYAQLPLKNVAIRITAPDQTAIAMRITDRSGLIAPVEIPVPDKTESQEPGAQEVTYTLVNLYAYLPGYERITAENLQVFADTTTFQDLEMIPLSAEPTQNEQGRYITPPQDL